MFSIISRFRFGYTTLSYWMPSWWLIPNENNLARYSAFATAIGLLLVNKNALSKIRCFFLCIICAFVTFLTQSRSGILLLVIVYISIVLFFGNNIKKRITVFLFLIIAGALLYVLINKYLPNLIPRIAARLEEEDLSNGRIDIFLYYHKLWTSKTSWLFFGFGSQNVSSRFGIEDNVHSAYQAYFVHYGLVGGCLFFGFLISFAKSFVQKLPRHYSKIVWVPFAVIAVGKIFGAMNTTELLIALPLLFVESQREYEYSTFNIIKQKRSPCLYEISN